MWWDSSDGKLYVALNNGTATASTALTDRATANDSTLRIGATQGGSSQNHDGDIARVGIWSRVLTSNERTSLFNSGAGKAYADLTTAEKVGLVSYWNLNETSGNRADSHGSNTLTDNNTVTSVINVGGAMRNAAASFVAGQQEYLSINTSPLNPAAGSFTISCWTKQDVSDGAIWQTQSGHYLYYLTGFGGVMLWKDNAAHQVNTVEGNILGQSVLTICSFNVGGIGPMQGQANVFFRYAPEKIPYAMNRYKKEANRLYMVVDRRLKESKYLACGEYTIADMATVPWLRFPERQGVEIDEYPALKEWRDAILERPAVQRALKVLADRRRTGPHTDKERGSLFGKTQYAKR